jgi:hypothetical protein
MTLAELRSLFRIKSGDIAAPYLWGDPEIDGFLNEAENEAAERASLIYDDTSATSLINVVPGTKRYPLTANVVRLDYAELTIPPAIEPDKIPIIDRREMRYRALFLIPDRTSIELNFTPDFSGTLRLGMYRLPNTQMTADTDTPEINARYHAKLLDWALHLAYLKTDSDSFDQGKADRHEAEFIANFGQRIDANVRRKHGERRRHVTRCVF